MKISDFGVAFIRGYEKLRLTAYLPTPNDVPTIGWGHTRGVKMGDTCTREQADAWLLEDLADAETCVNKRIAGIAITQGQYDALVSLCQNIGCGNFAGSTVLRRLLDGDDDGAADAFKMWNKQRDKKTGGMKELAGLTARRAAEKEIFRT